MTARNHDLGKEVSREMYSPGDEEAPTTSVHRVLTQRTIACK